MSRTLSMIFVKFISPFCRLPLFYGFTKAMKPAKKYKFPVHANIRRPAFSALHKADSNNARFITHGNSLIAPVSHAAYASQIIFSVVLSVAVNMVNLVRPHAVDNEPRHAMRDNGNTEKTTRLVPVPVHCIERRSPRISRVKHTRLLFWRSSACHEHVRRGFFPCHFPRFGVIVNKLRGCFLSNHCALRVADTENYHLILEV